MITYLQWWVIGGVTGIACALLVLWQRGALGLRTVAILPVTILACIYGAKLQFRLLYGSVLDAVIFAPSDLLAPGYHLPLGLALAFLAAIVMGRLLKAPLLDVGDALAVGGAVMMPIGRIGCLIAGCCRGTVCPAWMALACVRETMGTGARLVHLLPAYFILLALTILGLQLWLLRRGARPGTLAAVTLVVSPLGRLAIERLRDGPGDRGTVMTAVLVATLVINVLATCWVALRHRPRRRASRDRTVAILTPTIRSSSAAAALALAALASTSSAHAEVTAQTMQRWQTALPRYIQDPAAHLRDVIDLGRDGVDGLPPMFRLTLADAHLRAGHLRTAAHLFGAVRDDEPDQPWHGYAAVGGGWVAVLRGDVDDARRLFSDAAATPGATGVLAGFVGGMLDAAAGEHADALERFGRIAADAQVPKDLRVAATVAEGYARLWMGDDSGAEAAFERATSDAPTGPVADDARYGHALAQWRAGDRAAAEETLRGLADTAPIPGRTQASSSLVDLNPRGIVRATARRYRTLPLRMPADQVIAMFDRDTSGMARSALRRLQAGEPPPRLKARRARKEHRTTPQSAASEPASRAQHTADPTTEHAPKTWRPRSPFLLVALTVLLSLGIVRSWRRRSARR